MIELLKNVGTKRKITGNEMTMEKKDSFTISMS